MQLINLNAAETPAQRWLILDALQKGRELSTLDMMLKFKCVDGRKRISELRRLGYPIKDRMAKNERTGKHYKIYYYEDTGEGATPSQTPVW